MPDVSMFPPEMQKLNRGSVWGNAMLTTLRRSRITINVAVDGFDVQPPNMRVIEATGAGAFLLSNFHPELGRFFTPGTELETFQNADELIGKVWHRSHRRLTRRWSKSKDPDLNRWTILSCRRPTLSDRRKY